MKFIQYSGSTNLFIGHIHDQKGNSHFAHNFEKKKKKVCITFLDNVVVCCRCQELKT